MAFIFQVDQIIIKKTQTQIGPIQKMKDIW